MTKKEIVLKIAEESDIKQVDVKKVVQKTLDEIISALARGDRVEIRGFCSIYVKEYKGYTGRNPKSGAPSQVLPKKLPFFKCGKELKDRVDPE